MPNPARIPRCDHEVAAATEGSAFAFSPASFARELRTQPSLDRFITIAIRSAVAKKRKRVRVKQRIIKALAKLASREEEGITDIIRLVVKHYAKKARRRAKSAKRRSRRRAAKR